MTKMFDYLLLAMAVYVLYAGISGKGRLYAVENIKEGMEKAFKKTMRWVYIGLGASMVLNSATSLLINTLYTLSAEDGSYTAAVELGKWAFLTPELLRVLGYVFLGLTIAGVVLMIVVMRRFVDKEAQKKAQQQSAQVARQAGHILPVSAFEFDDEETSEPAAGEAAPPQEREDA